MEEYPVTTLEDGRTVTMGELVAERAYGPCPKGKKLIYRDGSPLNCTRANLAYEDE
jgi:hypothetical protein